MIARPKLSAVTDDKPDLHPIMSQTLTEAEIR